MVVRNFNFLECQKVRLPGTDEESLLNKISLTPPKMGVRIQKNLKSDKNWLSYGHF